MGAEQDPDRDGWPEYHRAPRDVVPRPPKPPDDIPEGMAEVVHYEITADGIERVAEHVYVTAPYTGRNTDHE
ncbi:hypothetical protein [Nocardia brevicatena]|uniref:hypothetical protein n=1 Tax=Nocardia brevicatena TaxID=37327 RepID=UPI0002DB8748|nr:hypothetical protein [Nocardia brevicatena]